jgi:hypothetical protein
MTSRRREPSRAIADPEPGFFRTRLVRGGPYVGARIEFRGGIWSATIDGVTCGASDTDPARADGVFRIWTSGARISEAEYSALLGPREALADERVNLNALKPVF